MPSRASGFVGDFGPTTGEEVVGAPLLTYAIDLPISVVFQPGSPLDRLNFNAEVVVPLQPGRAHRGAAAAAPGLVTPTEDQIGLGLKTDTRRGAMLRKAHRARLRPAPLRAQGDRHRAWRSPTCSGRPTSTWRSSSTTRGRP
ncbi:hypothetical protein [Nocardioides convexus]|uniref:hypothetical protein n=1 Tax=Nocardioides convexus TaxID=2712224 RepID=UPI0024188E7C|nr:hypothetical protein [Nocardioides convexus]